MLPLQPEQCGKPASSIQPRGPPEPIADNTVGQTLFVPVSFCLEAGGLGRVRREPETVTTLRLEPRVVVNQDKDQLPYIKHLGGCRRMKTTGIRYVALVGTFLLAVALAWTSLIEARGPAVSASRLMNSARLFEQQGRSDKAVELYRRVLRAEPGHSAATARLAIMRAKAVATFRSIEVAPQSTSKITPVEAVKPIRKTRSAEPAGTGLQKAGEALTKAGRRLGVLRTRSATTQLATKMTAGVEASPLIPAATPVVEEKPAVIVISPETPTDTEAGTIKEIIRTPKPVPVVVSEATTDEPGSAKAVPAGIRIMDRTKATWGKIRAEFVASRKSGKTPRSDRTPLWTRLNESLKRTREKLVIKLGRKSTAAVEAVEVVEPKPGTDVSPEKPAVVATETKVAAATPVEAKQPLAIPAKSVAEQILDAATELSGDSNDAAARSVLIDAVCTSPDIEASLAAYILGTRASGHPEVMTALGEQMSARTGVARVHMAEAMLRLDGNHVSATDTLIGMVSSKDMEVRMMAAFAMHSAKVPQRERCISTLIEVLDDSEADVRTAAALTLGAYGPPAKKALSGLVRLIHDENVDTARAAGIALQCIEPPLTSAEVDTKVTPVAAEAVGQ